MLNKDQLLKADGVNNWAREYKYPFVADDFITTFSTMLTNNWTENASKRCIQSPALGNSERSTVYLKIHTPKFPITLTFSGYTSSETPDYGSLYYGATQGLETGTKVYLGSGYNTAPADYTVTLPTDTDLYLNFGYRTDSSVSSYDNRFYVYGLRFAAVPTGVKGKTYSAGKRGFGVGVYPGTAAELAALGLTEKDGCRDKTSDNYGNYQHTNGSQVCFIPAFVFRAGDKSAPTYERDKDAALQISTNISLAGTNGWVLHRAFIDEGEVKSGFFVDKYLCNESNASVKGGSVYHPSVNYAQLQVKAKTRGSGWAIMSCFQFSALRMISLAHAQASANSTYCAYFDGSGSNLQPRGSTTIGGTLCSYDSSVTFQAYITGSCSNFAKSTHNGQVSGVADVAGTLQQALTCIANTSGGTVYTWPTTKKFADWTGASALDNGMQATSFNTSTMGGNWKSAGVKRFGTAYEGDERDLTGVYLLKSSGAGTQTTNIFGDGNCQTTTTAVAWMRSDVPGIWSSYYSWSGGGDTYVGYRCAAYAK